MQWESNSAITQFCFFQASTETKNEQFILKKLFDLLLFEQDMTSHSPQSVP